MKENDLRKRTKEYASTVIKLYCALPVQRTEVQVIGKQMLRSGTSVAANYREAYRARSGADFIAKLGICLQEADETMLWLELLNEDCNIVSDHMDLLLAETDELIAIFVSSLKTAKRI